MVRRQYQYKLAILFSSVKVEWAWEFAESNKQKIGTSFAFPISGPEEQT